MAKQSTNKNEVKRLPNGVSDFRRTMSENRYYVDKTMFLPTLEEASDFILLVRPRRFGKSLFVSMMKDYYDINRKDKFQEEFAGLEIAQNPTALQGYYQVLHFDFSQVESSGGNTLAKKFNNYCCRVIDEFMLYYSAFYDDKTVNRILKLKSHGDKIGAIASEARKRDLHVYLIIDEYDNFTSTILSEKGEGDYHKLTHANGFYREAFKAYKPNFERVFMIGVSPVTLNDLTSGYNIATNVSQDKDLNDIVGFSEKDVKKMIKYYKDAGKITKSIDEIVNEMRAWYDGYCFSDLKLDDPEARMYNSNMVLNYLSELLRNGEPPKDLVDYNSAMDFSKLRQIIEIDERNSESGHSLIEDVSVCGYTTAELHTNFSALKMTEPGYLPSLMYYYGMLTLGKDENGDIALVIPNINAKKQYFYYRARKMKAAGMDAATIQNISGLTAEEIAKIEC